MRQKTVVAQAVENFGFKRGYPNARGAQKEIAEALGVTRQTVRNWCISGSVSPEYLERFASLTETNARDMNSLTRRVAA